VTRSIFFVHLHDFASSWLPDQPTQTNSVSHGLPWIRIKKIMVGAAYA
jgi:hypothetical protein